MDSTLPGSGRSQVNRLCLSGDPEVPMDGRSPKMLFFILAAQA